MKLITGAAAIVALTATVPTSTRADMIILNGNTMTAAYTFTPVGTTMLMVSSNGFGGSATYGPDSGLVSFGTTSFTTEALVGNTLPIGPSPPGTAIQSFRYQASNDPDNPGPNFPDTLLLSIAWTELDNVSGEPHLIGTGTVEPGSIGDTPFETDFPVGGSATVTGNFPKTCSLNDLGNCNILSGMTIDSTGFFEGGDVTPGGSSTVVPEPMSSFAALVMALCGLWGAHQLTRWERRRYGVSA
jgi:hypothetical protein